MIIDPTYSISLRYPVRRWPIDACACQCTGSSLVLLNDLSAVVSVSDMVLLDTSHRLNGVVQILWQQMMSEGHAELIVTGNPHGIFGTLRETTWDPFY